MNPEDRETAVVQLIAGMAAGFTTGFNPLAPNADPAAEVLFRQVEDELEALTRDYLQRARAVVAARSS